MVGRRLEHGDVEAVLLVVFLYSLQELLLGEVVILVRHTQVPKDVLVARFRHQVSSGQLLGAVLVWPDGYDLEFPGVAVEVHLKEVSPVLLGAETAQFAPFLERDAFHPSRELVLVGVECHTVILEIIDSERIAVLPCLFLRADTADHSDPAGIYLLERGFLVMVHTPVFVGVDLDILAAVRQLQPGVPVFLRVDVAAAPNRVKAGVELDIVGPVRLDPEKPLVMTQSDRLAVLAPAYVDGLSIHPPFRPGLLGYLLESLVAVFAEIVDDDVPGPVDTTRLPVGDVPHTLVQAADNHCHMLPGRGCQREHRLILPVDHLYDKDVPQQALHPVQLDVIRPFAGGLLPGTVFLAQPVPFP